MGGAAALRLSRNKETLASAERESGTLASTSLPAIVPRHPPSNFG
jgi:hypothetical protein